MKIKIPPIGLILALCLAQTAAFAASATNSSERLRTVVIAPLYNVSANKDMAYLSKTIPDSLATSLHASGRFTILPRETVEKIIPPTATEIDYQKALKAGQDLKADIVITGAFVIIDDIIDISLEAIDVHSGRTKVAESSRGSTGVGLFDVVDSLCAKMAQKMTSELAPQAAYEIQKEEVRFQDVYVSEFRKNNRLLIGLGLAGIFDSSPSSPMFPARTPPGWVSSLIMEYGYKAVSLRLGGQPPLISLGGMPGTYYAGGGASVEVRGKLLKDRLTVFGRYYFMLNQNFASTNAYGSGINIQLFALGAGWRFSKAFYAEIGLGFDPASARIVYSSPNNLLMKTGFPAVCGEIEWMFFGDYGISVGFLAAGIRDQTQGITLSFFHLYPNLIYKASF